MPLLPELGHLEVEGDRHPGRRRVADPTRRGRRGARLRERRVHVQRPGDLHGVRDRRRRGMPRARHPGRRGDGGVRRTRAAARVLRHDGRRQRRPQGVHRGLLPARVRRPPRRGARHAPVPRPRDRRVGRDHESPHPGQERLRRRARRDDALGGRAPRHRGADALHGVPPRLQDDGHRAHAAGDADPRTRDRARQRRALRLHRQRPRPARWLDPLLRVRRRRRRTRLVRHPRVPPHRRRPLHPVWHRAPGARRRPRRPVGRAPHARTHRSPGFGGTMSPHGAAKVRPAAVAGRFYPGDERTLRTTVDEELERARPWSGPVPEALVVPHAGYVYSGPIAASGYATLAAARDTIHRVVLLGPAHYVGFEGIGVSSADAFATPLGDVRVDVELRERVLTLPGVRVHDAAHGPEHSLEVHLPFLQRTLADFALLPLVVGRAPAGTVAAVIDAVWTAPDTFVIVSTDLSHYLDYDAAGRRDRATAAAVVNGDIDDIAPDDACGAYPLRGLLTAARERDLTVELLDLRNSGDTAGLRDRVVGYAAFALVPPERSFDRSPGP